MAPHLKLFAEMAGRLNDGDFRDLASYDYPEEKEKNFSRIKRVVDDLDFGNGFTINPTESLLEYSWKKLSPTSIKNHEKRIFACVFLILNRCADEHIWLSLDSAVGSLLESLILVDPMLLRESQALFQLIADSVMDEDFKIFAAFGHWVEALYHEDEIHIREKFEVLSKADATIFRNKRKSNYHLKPYFYGLDTPVAIESWHGLRRLLRDKTTELDDASLKADISNLLDRLWMPTEHNYWKWNQRGNS